MYCGCNSHPCLGLYKVPQRFIVHNKIIFPKKNKWILPPKYLQEIKNIISKVYESWDFNTEDIIRDDLLENRDIRANIITQSFLIYDAGDNFETKFCFKQGCMSSHFFCRKAPFTLITNQILDLIKRNITYFQLQVE